MLTGVYVAEEPTSQGVSALLESSPRASLPLTAALDEEALDVPALSLDVTH